jgi:hypothetical protein
VVATEISEQLLYRFYPPAGSFRLAEGILAG